MEDRKEKFYKKWLVACGDDEELAVMLLGIVTNAIIQANAELDILESSDNPLSLDEVLGYHEQRINELVGDYATEEQIAIIIENIDEEKKLRGL
jgi:hypothetical protein